MQTNARTRFPAFTAADAVSWSMVLDDLAAVGYTVRELADALGVSGSAVRGWASGRRQPVGWSAVWLADIWRYERGRSASRRMSR